jgi:hypothetical protein
MTLDRIGRPIHPDDGAALSANSWPASLGEESDLPAPYAAWNGGGNAADGAGFVQAPGALRAALGVTCYLFDPRV